jgi:WD40 repeat protein
LIVILGSRHVIARLRDVARGAESDRLALLEGHSGPVTALCVLPDGRLASGSYNGDPGVGRGALRYGRPP